MTSLHLVDPEILPLFELPLDDTLNGDTLVDYRANSAKIRASWPVPSEPRVTIHEEHVPADNGDPDVRVLVYRPIGVPEPVAGIVHVHGGGYVVGDAEMAQATDQMLAAELGCVVVSVDYRLAPETPHPGPVEDCYAALRWLHRQAGTLGVDPALIGVFGESAGGGLAAALALLARDRGEFPVAFQHLIFPMIDDRTAISKDPHPYVGEFIWTPEFNRFGWQSLLGDTAIGAPDVSPYAAAARASELAGLPPTFIAVGALDLFLEEDLDYARRLTRAGVPVELHLYPGAPHAFQFIASAKVAQQAERDSLDALRRFTARPCLKATP